MTAPTRPILRYHGGKWRLAPWIISLFPAHRTYTEPYGGAASVLLRKPRSYAEVYNDLDSDVVNLFRILRDPGSAEELGRLVALTPYSRQEFDDSYEPCSAPLEQARRLLFRSAAGFGTGGGSRGTGFRSNVTRSSSTPADNWTDMPSVVEMSWPVSASRRRLRPYPPQPANGFSLAWASRMSSFRKR